MIVFDIFEKKDFDNFEENKFCKQDGEIKVFDDPECHKYTMFKNGKPIALICFKETAPRDFGGFFVISEDFTKEDSEPLRQFVNRTAKEFKAKRVWTASRQEEKLEHWHEFFGMIKEGTIKLEGVTCDVWSMKWE